MNHKNQKIMKIKLLIFSGAAALVVSAATLLLIQSCSKNESREATVPNLNSKKQVFAADTGVADPTLTNWFKRNSNSLGSIAYDQAFSVPLSSGKVYWLFGDTFYDDLDATDSVPCYTSTTGPAFNYHNSVLSQPSITNFTQSSTTNLTYDTSPQIYTALGKDYYWPGTGVEIGTSIYTYLTHLDSAGDVVGGTLGVLNESNNTVSYSTTLPSLNGISFDAGMFKIGTTVYVYGYKTTGTYGNSDMYVAQFSTSSPGTWTFWNGSTWVSSASSAAIIATTTSNAVSVSYIPAKSKYVMVYCAWNFGCGTDDGIYGMSATSPYGPFSSTPTKLYDIPDRIHGEIPYFYTPMIHPEFDSSTAFELTYCINYAADCRPSCYDSKATPDSYRPRAIKVPFTALSL
jgi:hypothetical protein